MFGWLKRKHDTRVIEQRSQKEREDISEHEAAYIAWALENEKPTCPDCQIGKLCKGPEGGCSMNTMCNHCTSEFNLTIGPSWVIGERISDAGAGDPKRARCLYGIKV